MQKHILNGGYCQVYVAKVYQRAGFGYVSRRSAYNAYLQCAVSDDKDHIPVGATVYNTGTGSSGRIWGHVGIYIGNGMVRDNIGRVRDVPLDQWIAAAESKDDSYAKKSKFTGQMVTGWLGWGWQAGQPSQILGTMNSDGSTNSSTASSITTSTAKASTTSSTSTSSSGSSAASSSSSSGANDSHVGESNSDPNNPWKSGGGTQVSLKDFLCIGDSVLNGNLGTKLKAEGANVVAKDGVTASYWIKNFDNQIANQNTPSGIFILLGQNACGYGTYQKAGVDDLKELIGKLQAKFAGVKIYVGSVIPTTSSGYSGNKNYTGEAYLKDQQALNQALQEYCNSTDGLTYIDILSNYKDDSSGYALDSVTMDGLHPNDSGAEILLQNIKNALGAGNTNNTTAMSSGGGPCAIVAHFQEVKTTKTLTNLDTGEVVDKTEETTNYIATTENIPYQSMVSGYNMPFDYLWTMLVISQDQKFVSSLADLVYNSKIVITVYENWKETAVTTRDVYYQDISATTKGTGKTITVQNNGPGLDSQTSIKAGQEKNAESRKSKSTHYREVETVTTTDENVKAKLTTADVWMLKKTEDAKVGDETTQIDPATEQDMNNETLVNMKLKDGEDSKDKNYQKYKDSLKELTDENKKDMESQIADGKSTGILSDTNVRFNDDIENQYVVYDRDRKRYVDTRTKSKEYVDETPEVTEKVDEDSKEPNFVTLYLKSRTARQTISDADYWSFEFISSNEDTVKLVDLTKYLLYRATDDDYGVTEFDYNTVFTANTFTSSGSANITGGDVPEKVWNALISKGYTKEQAAGVLGNIRWESNFNPTDENSKGAYGLCQWLGGRRKNLQTFAQNMGKTEADADTQILFLLSELEGSEGVANAALKRATTPEEAAKIFFDKFERAGDSTGPRRQSAAREYYNKYGTGS